MRSRVAWGLAGLATAGLLAGCSRADCGGVHCSDIVDEMLDAGRDGGPPDGDGGRPDGDAGTTPDAGPDCPRWVDIAACEGACPAPADVRLGLTLVDTAQNDAFGLPESVAFDPGREDRALGVSGHGTLAELFYDGDGLRFGRVVQIPTTVEYQFPTALAVHPSGRWAAVAIAHANCAPGALYLIDVADAFGTVLRRLEVGFFPDAVAFSPDGRTLVTADEDQRSNRPCKPEDRWGGSITVIEVAEPPEDSTVVQTIPIAHAPDAEPENIGIGSMGTVGVTLQDTSELVLFSLSDVPEATPRIVSLPDGSEPEGVAVDDALGFAVVTLERSDGVVVVSLDSGSVVQSLPVGSDLPAEWNRDLDDPVEQREPENAVAFLHQDAHFVAFPVQESHGLMAYRLTEAGALVFDSAAPVGSSWMTELGGTDKSRIGPEGLAVRADAGLFLTANEREGSVSLIRLERSRYLRCE